jgi:hypothetical protein
MSSIVINSAATGAEYEPMGIGRPTVHPCDSPRLQRFIFFSNTNMTSNCSVLQLGTTAPHEEALRLWAALDQALDSDTAPGAITTEYNRVPDSGSGIFTIKSNGPVFSENYLTKQVFEPSEITRIVEFEDAHQTATFAKSRKGDIAYFNGLLRNGGSTNLEGFTESKSLRGQAARGKPGWWELRVADRVGQSTNGQTRSG